MKIEEFRPSLAPFLAMPGIADSLDPRTLSALVEHRRNSCRNSSRSSATNGFNFLQVNAGSDGTSTPPLSPAESYAVLCRSSVLARQPL